MQCRRWPNRTEPSNQSDPLLRGYLAVELGRSGATPFHPRTVVLAGDIAKKDVSGARLRSFELFRNDLREVEVVAFDELAAKASGRLELFRG